MEGTVRITGLENALKAMRAAFPKTPEQQRRLLNQAMSGSAKKSIVPTAKQLALAGDSSGALSEAISTRAVSKSRARQRKATAAVDVVPVRSNRKAIALYISHYYTKRGKTPKTNIATSGIRHGHLVEFGTVHSAARPFMWPAAVAQRNKYIGEFSAFLKKKTEAAVRRQAKKGGKARAKARPRKTSTIVVNF